MRADSAWARAHSLVVAGLFGVATAAVAAEAVPLSAHDVAKLRDVGEIAIAPGGDLTAYTLTVPRTPGDGDDGAAWSELWVVDAGGVSRPFVTGEVNVSRVAWTADRSALSFLAERGEDDNKALYRIPIDGGEARKVLAHGDGIEEYAWAPDGSAIVFLAKREEAKEKKDLEEKGFTQQVFEEQWRPVEVWRAEVANGEIGEPRPLKLPGSASELSWSPRGGRLAVALAPTSLIDDHYMQRRVHVVDAESGEVAHVIDNPGKLGKVAWSPDGTRLALIAGTDAHDPIAGRLMTVPASGGAPRELLPGLVGDAIDVAWLDDETLLWISAVGVERTLERLPLAGGSKIVLPAGDRPAWTALSLAEDGRSLALVGQTPEHPGEVFLGTLDDGVARRATVSNPWLAERTLVPQEVVTFTARDGLELEGLLLRPLGAATGERVPLVLIVHGGPEAHFTNGWLTGYSRPGQVLAGRGYAVFYPNYRGSTGRGLDFAKISQADPAGKEFDDLIDAVDHLIASGLVDSDKVAVTGGSYGGYATAWSSTYHSERFAAGVMFVGISEKVAKLGTSDIPNELYMVHARRWPWDDWQLMLERSPVYYVEKARTPLLILGGDADPRVHPSQSLVLYRYLKILGQAPVRYVVYPGEKHGNRKAAARLDYSLRLLRWFDHYLKGPGGDPPAHELDYGLADDAADDADEE